MAIGVPSRLFIKTSRSIDIPFSLRSFAAAARRGESPAAAALSPHAVRAARRSGSPESPSRTGAAVGRRPRATGWASFSSFGGGPSQGYAAAALPAGAATTAPRARRPPGPLWRRGGDRRVDGLLVALAGHPVPLYFPLVHAPANQAGGALESFSQNLNQLSIERMNSQRDRLSFSPNEASTEHTETYDVDGGLPPNSRTLA